MKGEPYLTAVVTWPEQFRKNFSQDQILKADFLTGIPTADGSFFCKACGKNAVGSRSDHYEQHEQEYLAWEAERQERINEERRTRLGSDSKPKAEAAPKSPYYTNPCRVCNQPIPRTGKRGKPPVAHAECRAK